MLHAKSTSSLDNGSTPVDPLCEQDTSCAAEFATSWHCRVRLVARAGFNIAPSDSKDRQSGALDSSQSVACDWHESGLDFLSNYRHAGLSGDGVKVAFDAKAAFDYVMTALLLVPLLPLLALLILLVKLTSRGPGIYRQKRVGLNGSVYSMYKLRTMRVDAESITGPVWSGTQTDPRVTPLGVWLRRLHLDELPQLINVLRGEMSLVGPRPERPEFVPVLAQQIPGYLARLSVKPGITGLAQLNLPADTDLDSVRRKLVLDLEYIRASSLWLNIRILLCTVFRALWIRSQMPVRLFGLERTVSITPTDGERLPGGVTLEAIRRPSILAGANRRTSVSRREVYFESVSDYR